MKQYIIKQDQRDFVIKALGTLPTTQGYYPTKILLEQLIECADTIPVESPMAD